MNRYITLSVILLCSAMSIFAQVKTELSDKVKNEVETLKKADLNLSDVQLSRITQVLVAQEELYIKNMKTLEGNKSLLSQRIAELKAAKINNIKGGLTPQQVEKFTALKLEEKFN